MEHEPWIPDGFSNMAQRILVVGHSHHRKADEPDHEDFTVRCVQGVLEGDEVGATPFFSRQPRYMGLTKEAYYNRIALINFVPEALLDRYAEPSAQQMDVGRDRLLRIISQNCPTHIFVTTSRLHFGKQLPPTAEQEHGGNLQNATTAHGTFEWGTYETPNCRALCCRLRHPQAATTAEMIEAFDYMLAMNP